jgi:hypothetical protein
MALFVRQCHDAFQGEAGTEAETAGSQKKQQKWSKRMAKEPTHTQHFAHGHHVKAAKHLEQAWKHHNEAAGHSAAGHHETAAHYAHSAHAHMLQAAHHASEAAKAHGVHKWRCSERSIART